MNTEMFAARLRRVSGFSVALVLTCALAAGLGLAKRKILSGPGVAVRELASTPSTEVSHPRLAHEYGTLPLSFEANQGQTDPSVQFVSHSSGYTLFLRQTDAFLVLQGQGQTDIAQQKKDKKRKLFEASKLFRGTPRSRKSKKTKTIHVTMEGANPNANIQPLRELPGKTNYFVGNDPKKWRTGIPTFEGVKYAGIYPGIDLVYHGNRQQLEFDFVVAPGADAEVIGLNMGFDGQLTVTKTGNLCVRTGNATFQLKRPEIYQMDRGKKQLVSGGFVKRSDYSIGFQLGAYDHRQPLIIDPTLAYSTYLGGNGTDGGYGIAVDSSGNAYITGETTSTNFPALNGYTSGSNTNGIAFVSKLNATGTTLLYSTYLGGTGGESGNGIALDPNGNVYVTGYTMSTDFPVVNGFQTTIGTAIGNVFVARIDTTQSGTASLTYSTYLGGGGNSANPWGDYGEAIAVDASGFAYVTGLTSSDTSIAPFPTTPSAYQDSLLSEGGNAFLTVVDTNLSGAGSLVYSTYLGGASGPSQGDIGVGIAVDNSGDAYITGQTDAGGSAPFPTTANAYQSSLHSTYGNAFVTEISTTQSGAAGLIYSTYLGGSGDSSYQVGDLGYAITLDSLGKVYVAGESCSTDFPLTSGAFETSNPFQGIGFVAKLDLTQAGTQGLLYSTFLGGTNGDAVAGISVDPNGNAIVAGDTFSVDFPTTSGALQTTRLSSASAGFLTQLNSTGASLLYSTYLGGSCANGDIANAVATDPSGSPYTSGWTCSTDFPVFPSNAYQTSLAGAQNAFITKLSIPVQTPTVSMLSTASGIGGATVTLTGVNFGLSQGASTVTFGGVAAGIFNWSSNSITAQIPTTAEPGIVSVLVTTSAASSNAVQFTIIPSISSLSPFSAPIGATVAISGNNFGSSGTVTFNGVSATTTSWSSSFILATVPSGTNSGNVVVTSNSTPSAGTAISIIPPANLSGISVNSGVSGASVTITGSGFSSSQASAAGNVVFNGANGSITSWSDGSIVAQVPSGAAPGLGTLTVTLGGVAGNSFPFTVIPSLSPAAGASSGGYLVISGTDLGTSQGSGSLSVGGLSPQIVNWNPTAVVAQVPASLQAGTVAVSVTTGGITTNSVSYTISPGMTTISPAAGQVGATVTISGTALGTSGSITFNGMSGSIQGWTNTRVTALVPSGTTTGPVVLTTSGIQTNPINFTVLSAPNPLSAITVQPASASILVGDTRNLLAVDNNGNTITGATWTVNDYSLASISTDVPPILTALSAGSITLTATYQSVTAQATWTISGAPLAIGTAQWSLPADGLNVQEIIPALPVPGGAADLFSVEASNSGEVPYTVRAVTIDGNPVWSAQVPATGNSTWMADSSGGLVTLTEDSQIIKVDPSTGQQDWEYSVSSAQGLGQLAAHPNGTIFTAQQTALGCYNPDVCDSTDQIVGIDDTTGQTKFVVSLPQSRSLVTYFGAPDFGADVLASLPGPFTIMPDGSTTVEVFWQDEVSDNECFPFGACVASANWHAKLYLVTIQVDGSSTMQVLDSSDIVVGPVAGAMSGLYSEPNLYYIPGEIIPDGQGGLLASWSKWELFGNPQYVMTHVSGGSATSYSSPDSVSLGLVLGDNGTAFGVGETGLVAFDVNSGAVKWTYSQQPGSYVQNGDGITIVAASDGGGLVAKSTSNGIDTIIDFDVSGNPTTDPLTGNGLSYMYADLWLSQPLGGGPLNGPTGNPVPWVVGDPWSVPGTFSRISQQINIPLTLSQVQTSGPPAALSAASIDSQVTSAAKLWGNLVRGLTLTYGGPSTIQSAPACAANLHPTGCSTQQDVSTLFLDSTFATTSMAEFKTRFGNSTGLQLVFTGTIDFHPPGGQADVFPDEAALYDPPGQHQTFGNIVVMSSGSQGNIPAHGIGHSFQLGHVEGAANVQNLMCSPQGEGCPPDVPGNKLNKDQVREVLQNSLQWAPSQ